MRKAYKTFWALLVLVIGCNIQPDTKQKDLPTAGHICICADHEFELLTRAELEVFSSLYADATIKPLYKTEDSAFDLLLKDSVRLIVAGRKLSSSEEKYFHDKKLNPGQYKIAGDAVTFIVNNNNADTLLSVDELKAVFAGQDSTWQQLNNKFAGKIEVVFDYENSANAAYIQNKLINGGHFPAWCFALHGNRQVMDYISKNKNAVGIIGVNWISDEYDTAVIRALTTIKVMALAVHKSTKMSDYYKPWPVYIQSGQYPLSRNIYIISREAYTGLGSGFLAFVTSDKGQRIVYREGLVPARMPSQTIHY